MSVSAGLSGKVILSDGAMRDVAVTLSLCMAFIMER